MPVYTVHGPNTDTRRPAADRITFVRDGVSFWAFLLGPLWLIWNRLWWALLGYVAVMIVASVAMAAFGLSSDVKMVVNLLLSVLLGLEAMSLRRWTLSRGKWRQLDVVVADDEDAAERRFFDRFAGARYDFDAPDRGAPPPSRPPAMRAPAMQGNGQLRNDIIGLFPQPGDAR